MIFCTFTHSMTAHTALNCKTPKPGYLWQASEYLTGQTSSTYSCVSVQSAGSYCCDNTVILVVGNQKDLTDTQTKCFLQELLNQSTLEA